MITIKKRIGLEPFINREYPSLRVGINSSVNIDEKGCPIPPLDVEVAGFLYENPKYGQIDKSFIVFPIFFSQKLDDMGLYTDEEFIEAANLVNVESNPYFRLTGLPLENYFTSDSIPITGFTDSALDLVTTYNTNNPYIVGFNLDNEPSKGFTGVLEIKNDSIVYVLGGQVSNIGSYVPYTGVLMETFSDLRQIIDPKTGEIREIPLTNFSYYNRGIQGYNSTLSAIVHQDKYLGVVMPPRVDNDILIDRGTVNVMERFLKISEIDSVEQLEKYGQGFFKVSKT